MSLDARSTIILQASIESYIKTGEPISSAWLFDHYDFGIKPAMIRHELNYLEEEGYLTQPHHSAGRVPTNKSYEWYVRDLLSNDSSALVSSKSASRSQLADSFKARAWDLLVENLSHQLGVLGVAWDSSNQHVHTDGLHNVVAGVDWQDASEIIKIVYDFERLSHTLTRATDGFPVDDIAVFVGKRNPVIGSEEVAAMVAGYALDDGQVVYVCAVGPKRMNYAKVISTLQGLNNF
jgi:transcriptional regulator of heat shock response